MNKSQNPQPTPSEYYRQIRPEYFSDSNENSEAQMPSETFAFELSQITTNQKQDEFEVFCRRLAEKEITPNLIPQTGPTGGGDGKTDSETYPVSKIISDRWFVPENGWENDEKWAIAISAKKKWKEKLKDDIKKIVETNRGYTRVYFMTNQTPSSKQRKDAEDSFKKEFRIDIVIIDGKWILEKVYNNQRLELAINSLNLSSSYKTKKILGKNDAERVQRLEELENNISNPNRYSIYDFQLVEDALESAIISRMLEKPKDEVIGKFDRALRFGRQVENIRQTRRLHYQRAWTLFYWYEEYSLFIEDYKSLKLLLSDDVQIETVELLVNLFCLLQVIPQFKKDSLDQHNVSISEEENYITAILQNFITDSNKPCSALIARTHLILLKLTHSLLDEEISKNCFIELSSIFIESEKYPDYPFYMFKTTIQKLGQYVPDSKEYDNVINVLAEILGKYSSASTTAKTYLKRGAQKLEAKLYRESTVYFGKAVYKLSKDETQDGMYLALMGLSEAYLGLGLIWASNNSLISAASIAFKSWYKSGKITKQMFDCIRLLVHNELRLGRIPSILSWFELFKVISIQLNHLTESEEVPTENILDAYFSCRILNSKMVDELEFLPEISQKLDLWHSKISALYLLGYIDDIKLDFDGTDIKTIEDIEKYFHTVASNSFKERMVGQTDYYSSKKGSISSIILGCNIKIDFVSSIESILCAEMLMAFLESFLSTALDDVMPNTETISILLTNSSNEQTMVVIGKEATNEYELEININNWKSTPREDIWKGLFSLLSEFLSKNFFISDASKYLKNVFENEEVNERVSLVFEHARLTTGILGNPKLLFADWVNSIKKNENKRVSPLIFSSDKSSSETKIEPNLTNHSQRQVYSVIEDHLWNQAQWQAFGFFTHASGLGVFIAFKDGITGKRIFDNWINRFGKVDKEESIKITIIKGVDKANPFTYRIHISSNINKEEIQEGKTFITASRFHELNAETPDNLYKLLKVYETQKSFWFYPAAVIDGVRAEPIMSSGIYKQKLYVKNAWEIGEHDLDNVAIRASDNPIIPVDVKDAPIIKVLERLNKK